MAQEFINYRIKTALKMYRVPTWRLAEVVGCSETTMFRRLRRQFPPEEEEQIVNLIERIAKEKS